MFKIIGKTETGEEFIFASRMSLDWCESWLALNESQYPETKFYIERDFSSASDLVWD